MPTVFVNGQEITIGEKERLNGIQAAERAGVDIPYYCWHPGLSVVAGCRMYLVEAGKKDDKTGECSLQDFHFEYGQQERRADIKPFTSRRRSLGETVTLFVDRCVMCSRCVRFTREISGTSELMVTNRGAHEE